MLRKKRPHYFTVGEDRFQTIRLGYLTSGELLMKYAPVIQDLYNEFSEENGQAILKGQDITIDIKPILDKVPDKMLRDLSSDLFEKTKVGNLEIDEETGENRATSWDPIDPEDFEGFGEMFNVAVEVFRYNFPSFFMEGDDTEDEVPEPKKQQVPKEKKDTQKPEIVQL